MQIEEVCLLCYLFYTSNTAKDLKNTAFQKKLNLVEKIDI